MGPPGRHFLGLVRMEPDRGGEQEGEGRAGGNEGIVDMDGENEKDTVWSFVSFSSEKETKEPWPPPLLQMMLDLDPYQFAQTTKHKDDTNK